MTYTTPPISPRIHTTALADPGNSSVSVSDDIGDLDTDRVPSSVKTVVRVP